MAITDKIVECFFDRLAGWFEKAEKNRDRELGGKAMLRAYYIEVCGNLDLIDSLDMKALKESSVNAPGFAAIVNHFETRIAEAILTDDEAARENGLYQVLQKTESAKEIQRGITYKNVLEAVSFTLIKVEVMRKLSSLSEEEKTILHGIDLVKRIENLKRRLLLVEKILREDLGGITGIPEEQIPQD